MSTSKYEIRVNARARQLFTRSGLDYGELRTLFDQVKPKQNKQSMCQPVVSKADLSVNLLFHECQPPSNVVVVCSIHKQSVCQPAISKADLSVNIPSNVTVMYPIHKQSMCQPCADVCEARRRK